jgi:hypothetical protein
MRSASHEFPSNAVGYWWQARGGGSTMNEGPHNGRHDFDFRPGRWHIENERLLERLQGCTEWEHFPASSTGWLILDGIGNMDDFVTEDWRPGFIGMSLRLFNPQTKLWSIYWMSNQTGKLEPPVVGGFKDGIGIFEGDDVLEGRPIRLRFTWSKITTTSALWEQEFSDDGGQTWEKNWIMRMTRITP